MPSNKLLYILPDVTYYAELLPTKKEFTFAVQSFRQINGEYLNDTEFLPENIEKLFSKFKGETFTSLVLPDFLFTNTIVTVKETDETKVIAHLKETLLPSLGLTTDTHYVNSFVLTQFKGESRVQISALEKSVLAAIRVSAAEHNISIEGINSLSWTSKSIISLEPSISILQVGSKLYSALHYIGIDQTTVAELDEIPNIVETIKTLKGGEPSIQTIYLLSNSLVEETLTDQLKATLPIQQLASFKEEDAKMPSYIKQIIESGMKTLSIPDYLTPSFKLEKPFDSDLEIITKASNQITKENSETDDAVSSKKKESDMPKTSNTEKDELPTPTLPEKTESGAALSTGAQVKKLDLSAPIKEDEEKVETEAEKEPETTPVEKIKAVEETSKSEEDVEETTTATKEKVETPAAEEPSTEGIDLRKFSKEGATMTHEKKSPVTTSSAVKGTVIKNKSGVGNMLKMVFITLAVFFATVAVGVGVGLGLLKFTQNGTELTPAPVVVEAPETTEEASASAEIEEVAFVPDEYTVLVVNATTKAGYAGTIKSSLSDADFTTIDAANAKGDYDEGNYLLVAEEIPGLKKYVEDATELSFTIDTDTKDVEDTTEKYDIVVVLAE